MRVRSPSSAPPRAATTDRRRSRRRSRRGRHRATRRRSEVDLPTPGGPVRPTTCRSGRAPGRVEQAARAGSSGSRSSADSAAASARLPPALARPDAAGSFRLDRAAQGGLRRRQPRDRHAERRAGDVVEAGAVAEVDRGRVAAVLAADADLEVRAASAAALDADLRSARRRPSWSSDGERVVLEDAALLT